MIKIRFDFVRCGLCREMISTEMSLGGLIARQVLYDKVSICYVV